MRLYIYYFSFVIGLAFACLCSIHTGRKTGIVKRDAAVFTVMGFTAGVIGAVLMSFIYNSLMKYAAGGEVSSVSLFSLYGGILFTPLLLLLPLKSAGKDIDTALDTCCAGVYLLIATAKIGCHIYGCCYGNECSFGVINPQNGMRVFPVQLLESLLTFIISAVIYFYTLKEKRPKGSVYPLGLIIYGVMRFGIQFLRFHESQQEKHLFLFMDIWQTVSLISVISGIIWLLFINRRSSRTGTDNIGDSVSDIINGNEEA